MISLWRMADGLEPPHAAAPALHVRAMQSRGAAELFEAAMGPLARGTAEAFERRGTPASAGLAAVTLASVPGTHLSFLSKRREARLTLHAVGAFLCEHEHTPMSPERWWPLRLLGQRRRLQWDFLAVEVMPEGTPDPVVAGGVGPPPNSPPPLEQNTAELPSLIPGLRDAHDEPPAAALEFHMLRYTVRASSEAKPAGLVDKLKGSTFDKDLLLDVSGSVNPGSVLAILGPSGAGKTTLLNMLTLEKKGGVPRGHIRVDGAPFTLAKYSTVAAYVQQFDTLWASLTVFDHLVCAMRLYQPQLEAVARVAAINDLVKSVGLEDHQHVKAGNEFTRGLSGGNKRRLSIALALAKRPSVLFLDEPTSGIDSASAVVIMSLLKAVAKARSVIIVCTIHQPPASVFAGFDSCMVLSMGRVAYFGKADSMGAWFASIGNPPPPQTNMAEFVLDLCAFLAPLCAPSCASTTPAAARAFLPILLPCTCHFAYDPVSIPAPPPSPAPQRQHGLHACRERDQAARQMDRARRTSLWRYTWREAGAVYSRRHAGTRQLLHAALCACVAGPDSCQARTARLLAANGRKPDSGYPPQHHLPEGAQSHAGPGRFGPLPPFKQLGAVSQT